MEIRRQDEYEIADKFRSSVENGRIWLGGTDSLHDGTWVWISNEERINRRKFWEENKPYLRLRCLELTDRGMNDIGCETLLPFVCEVV